MAARVPAARLLLALAVAGWLAPQQHLLPRVGAEGAAAASASTPASAGTCKAGLFPDEDANGYQWFTKSSTRQLGQSLIGNQARLRAAIDR